MGHRRGMGLLAVVGLVVGASGCSAAPDSVQVEANRQAQAALARWEAAVAAGVGGSGLVLAGDSTLFVGDDWGPNLDGGNAKLALGAGLFELASPLPSDTPPDGTIEWQDGTAKAAPLISAQQAFLDLKASAVQACPDCTPLQITAARLTTATFQTSRGPAQVPAWEFSLKDTDVKLDQVAVSRFAPPPRPTPDAQGNEFTGPWIGPPVTSASVKADGMTITVSFVGAPDGGDKPCGADYTAAAVESDSAVVLMVYEHRNPTPAACILVGAARTAQVTLAEPLGSRTLIDLLAQPVSVARGG